MTGTLAATDVDGGALSYSIVGQGSKGIVAIANPTNGAFTYTPNLNSNGSDSFSFKAIDAEGATSNVATISVAIAAVNDAPSISLIPNQNTAGGVPISPIPITVADVDSSVNSLVLSAASSNTAIVSVANIQFGGSAANRTIIVTPSVGQIGSTTVTVTVSDGSASTNTVFTVAQDPAAPQISSSLVATATKGQSFSYQIVGSNSPTSFAANNLANGITLNPSTGVISGTPTAPGVYAVTLSVSNSGGTGSAILTLTVNPPAPVISSALSISATKGEPFSYQIVASNSPASYAASGLPSGLNINPNSGAISGTPTAVGFSAVALSATNSGGTGNATLILSVNLPAPQISSSLSVVATKDQAFSYQIVASNSPATYAASGLPLGLGINANTGVISGSPVAIGISTITLSAANAAGVGTSTLIFTVNPQAPQITSTLTAVATKGELFSYQIAGNNIPTSYGANGLPTGLSINASTGLMVGVPTATGNSTVTLTATNAGGTGSAVLLLAVNPPAPQISSPLSAEVIKGQAFSYQIVGSNSPVSYAASGLPSGVVFNPSTGAITGMPTATGAFLITLSASNSGGSGSAVLTLAVNSPSPQITSAMTTSATRDQAFSYQIVGSNSPTSYGASGLPSGLEVNTVSGLISGTPTSTGVSTVTLTASNNTGTGSATLILTVALSPQPPVISATPFPAGKVGDIFVYQIAASNSPTSYGATGLPGGLSVNGSTGLISGFPVSAGESSVTLTSTNSVGNTLKMLTLKVNPPAPEISSALSASGPKGETFSYQIAASNSPTRFAAIGLPAGLSVNISTGLISGTPMTGGASSVTLTATNAGGIDSEILLLMIEEASTSATLTVAVAPANGGRVMAGFSGSTSRDIGLSYTITAVPAPGFVFSSWSGSASGGSPTLVFTMADGFSLQANFMPDPLLTARGVFNGLALADVPINGTTGRVKIVIGLGGKFTGKLVLAGIYYPISGAFGVEGSATFGDGKRATRALLRQGAATLDLALHLDINGGGHHITGTLSDAGNVVSTIQADHTLFTDAENPVSPRRNVPVELTGAYTFLFPPVVADGVVTPKGNGWGRAIVMPNGAVRIAGTLADGTAISSSTVLAQDATLPLYVPLYNNGGAVCGKVSLVSEAGNDVSGNVVWFRPPTPGRPFYPAGWKDGIILGLRGSHFLPTVAAVGRGAAPINVSVTLSGGNLDADLIASAFLSSAGVTLESAQAIRGFSLNVNSASGVFSGRFIPPGGRAMETFKGVVLQNQNAAAGFFLGSTESGSIEVAEPNMSN